MVKKKRPDELTDDQAIRRLFPKEIVEEIVKPVRKPKRKAPGQKGDKES